MADRAAIEDMLARYAYGNDIRDIDVIGSTLSENFSITINIAGSDSYGPFAPRTGAIEFMGGALDAQTDLRRHVLTNITVLEDNGDRAKVNAYLTLVVTDNGATEVKSAGLYETEIVVENGKPLLDKMVLSLDNGF